MRRLVAQFSTRVDRAGVLSLQGTIWRTISHIKKEGRVGILYRNGALPRPTWDRENDRSICEHRILKTLVCDGQFRRVALCANQDGSESNDEQKMTKARFSELGSFHSGKGFWLGILEMDCRE